MAVLHWGIAGSGKICHDFVCALRTLNSNNHKVEAIAARSLETAQEFANLLQINIPLEGYENLAKHPSINIVYIGLINPQHYPVAKMMLDHGKHVLCEKPLTTNVKDTKELLDYANKKGLFLMEAVFSRCFPLYEYLGKILEENLIGKVYCTNISFGFPIAQVENIARKDLGGGAILNMGIYILQLNQLIFKKKVCEFLGTGTLNSDGVDMVASGIMKYSDTEFANFIVSVLDEMPNNAEIIGTKGTVTIPLFWSPSKLIISEKIVEFPLPESKDTFNFPNSEGLAYEAEECRKCIEKGLLESPKMSHANSLELAELMEEWIKFLNKK